MNPVISPNTPAIQEQPCYMMMMMMDEQDQSYPLRMSHVWQLLLESHHSPILLWAI